MQRENFCILGQILNKFSKDVGIADNDLNRCFFDFSRVTKYILRVPCKTLFIAAKMLFRNVLGI